MMYVDRLAKSTNVKQACRALGMPRAIYYRFKSKPLRHSETSMRCSPLALSELERRRVLDTLHSERFVDPRGLRAASLRRTLRNPFASRMCLSPWTLELNFLPLGSVA